jgi:putative tricarboxylic transport membrane protein
MALDRWIALLILLVCCVYGYAAWFTMDGGLPPFMRRNPVWPSSFPKVLSIAGGLVALWVLVFQAAPAGPKADEIDYRRLGQYKLGQAAALVVLMAAYAFALRPVGFIGATTLFLALSGAALGERKLHILIPVSLFASGVVWWLVSELLGIFLRPLPQGF